MPFGCYDAFDPEKLDPLGVKVICLFAKSEYSCPAHNFVTARRILFILHM